MARKPTKQETIDALTTALAALIHQDTPDGVIAAYAHAKELLQELGAMPVETVTVPMTPNRVAAIFCEMHKAQFGQNPRFDVKDRQALIDISKMFSGTEEVLFREIVREFFNDDKCTWINGGPNNRPMMHCIQWLCQSARVMRYERQIADRERQEEPTEWDVAVTRGEPKSSGLWEGVPT